MNDYNIDVIRTKYALVPRTLVFINKGEKILMLKKQIKESFGYGKINGVGGHIEKGEEPYEAAIREVREETAMTVRNMDMVTIVFIDIKDIPGILLFVFRADHEAGELIESTEGELLWMSRSEISTNDLVLGDIPYLIEICDNYEHGKMPQILKYIYDENDNLRIVKCSY